ncbi:YetF domain-containing protein [Alkalibacillus haloalkaliphilus]|uniref:YetF domain-containing protein n=1 Tax=Alkalibacillus haloalkaliphilus TaxID=94136 RepID=UPI00030C13AB
MGTEPMEFVRITMETIVGFAALFALTKVLGKSQITQITPFDFIAAIILGELIGNALYDKEIGISMILFAVTLWGVLLYTIETITNKFRKSRKPLEGSPSLIIRRGEIQKDLLKKSKLDMNQFMHLLRDKNVFSIQEVEYAVLETNGTVNVLKKFIHQLPTNEILNQTPKSVELPISIISDGEIVEENLKEISWNLEDIEKEVEQQGLTIQDIMYAEWTQEKGLYVMPY